MKKYLHHQMSIFLGEDEKDYLNSYNNISNSKIVLGTPSTLLREALVYDAKVLCCETDPCEEGLIPFQVIII